MEGSFCLNSFLIIPRKWPPVGQCCIGSLCRLFSDHIQSFGLLFVWKLPWKFLIKENLPYVSPLSSSLMRRMQWSSDILSSLDLTIGGYAPPSLFTVLIHGTYCWLCDSVLPLHRVSPFHWWVHCLRAHPLGDSISLTQHWNWHCLRADLVPLENFVIVLSTGERFWGPVGSLSYSHLPLASSFAFAYSSHLSVTHSPFGCHLSFHIWVLVIRPCQ